MISVALARKLRDAGLTWEPANGDRFFIPDRNLDDRVFSISDMSVEARSAPGGELIAFNGAVEWALDAILQREVVWLPSEAQLREALGTQFAMLERHHEGYRCVIDHAGRRLDFEHEDAAECYGLALLYRLTQDAA